ncbi:MAG TPA: hypothetical protein VHP33_20505, partial [Polyangiaceae bacterium]|nr:hypothetical protein [Polyangiaceae bacterium]
NLSVQGTKNFQIDHPLEKGKDLVHAAMEGPEAAVMYRGEAQLSGGQCEVVLPKYFEALVRPEDRSVLLTPLVNNATGAAKGTSALATSAIVGGKFTVYALDDRNPSQAFYWEAKGVRSDVERLVVEPSKRHKPVGPAPQPAKPMKVSVKHQ